MYVTTDYIPRSCEANLTAGKYYEIEPYGNDNIRLGGCCYIMDDSGLKIIIQPNGCAFLNEQKWSVTHRVPALHNMVDDQTWYDIERENGGELSSVIEFTDEQKDRLCVEAIEGKSDAARYALEYLTETGELAKLFGAGPAQLRLDALKSAIYIALESDLVDEYESFKGGKE